MEISLEIAYTTVLARLQTLNNGLKRDVLLEVSEYLLEQIQKRFLAETDPEGRPWVPSRAAIREHRRTLYDTHRLFHSIAIEDIFGDARQIATDVPYAIKHQLGIGVIARPFMGVTAADEQAAVDLITKRIRERVGGE